MTIASINPATGETLKTFEALSDSQIEEKLRLAVSAFSEFRKTTFAERAARMMKAAEILESDKEKFGRVMTTEMGKTYRSAVDEAAKCAWVCRYYAENAERFLADELADVPGSKSFVRYLPLGPISGGDAVELSVLAGFSFHWAVSYGGKCRSAEARIERAAIGVAD